MHDSSFAVFCSSRFLPTRIVALLEQAAQPLADDLLRKINDSIRKLRKTLGEMEEPTGGQPNKPKAPPE